MPTTIESPETRVARGAKLLDEIRPGWAAAVNLDRLAMESCSRCVLGQVFGEYTDGLTALGIDEETNDQGIECGFDEPGFRDPCRPPEAFDLLASAWRLEIRSRLTPLSPSPIPPIPTFADVRPFAEAVMVG